MAEPAAKLRIDKWLWFARFFKTRTLAAKQVGAGHLRVNGDRIVKPAETVAPGDVLTFAQGSRIRVIRVLAIGERRGPAPEAQLLYEDLSPADSAEDPAERAGARPTKRDRRAIDALRPDLSDE